MSKSKKIAILAIVAMVLMMLPVQLFAADTTDRISGADRIGTAIAIADAGWTSADTVILAPSANANLVDALAAAPLAGQDNAPILLTDSAALNATVKAKIVALGAKNVILVGALSDAVKNEVAAISGVTVEVLKGASRWETTSLINAKLTSPAGTFVVGYNAIPDALSAASFAAKNKYQIVLADVNGAIPSGQSAVGTVYIVGGPTLVKDITGATRIYGADRFATNKEIANKLSFSYGKVYVANGLSCVDALSVAPLAAKDSAFVALASASDVAAASVVNDKLDGNSSVIAVGGTGAVPDAVKSKIGLSVSNPVSCAVKEKDYDNDTKDQYVEFTVNGQACTIDALNAMGWDAEFTAGTSKSDPTGEDIFADATTGLLNSQVDDDDYYVQLTLTKDADIIISTAQKITVKNLNLVASGISGYELYANGGTTYEMNSTKLVTGDTATFTQITVTNGSSKEDIAYGTGAFDLDSSDNSVISVDDNVMTAQGPGSATITLTYGNATKNVTFTVESDAREADKVQITKTDGTVVTSAKFLYDNVAGGVQTETYLYQVLDQYGDVMDGESITATAGNTGIISDITLGNWSLDPNKTTIVFSKHGDTGTTTITFNNSDDQKLNTFSVTVSDDTDVNKYSFEMYKVDTDEKLLQAKADLATIDAAYDVDNLSKDDFSTDTTLDASDDAWVVYQVKKLNDAGISIGNDNGITASFTQSDSGVVDTDLTTVATPLVNNVVFGQKAKVYVHATDEGTATLKVTDSYGTIHTVKLTVKNEGYTIKSITMKTPATSDYGKTYNYKSVLTTTSTGNDPILDNVTLNKTAAESIRLDVDGVAGAPSGGTHTTARAIYIDKDSDGVYSAGDTIAGWFEMTTSGTISDAPANAYDDIVTAQDDDGYIYFKVWSASGDDIDSVVASKSVKVEL